MLRKLLFIAAILAVWYWIESDIRNMCGDNAACIHASLGE
jgi:hypothetical protein